MAKVFIVSVVLLCLAAGCYSEPRYQAFTLHKEVIDESKESEAAKTGTHSDVTRNVLVDRKTGRIIYFSNNGELASIKD